MATVKIKFRESTADVNAGKIYMQVIHNREAATIKTAFKISTEQWLNKALPDEINVVENMIKSSIVYLEQRHQNFSVCDIIKAYQHYEERSLFYFMRKVIEQLKYLGKFRTAETYTSTLNSLKRYRENIDIELHNINGEIVKGYEVYLYKSGVKPNTITFYMRIFRATYNRAVDEDLILSKQPFKHISIKAEKTLKRALTASDLRLLSKEDLSQFPAMEFARDMFLFSFYTRGMSFIDMAHLRKKDLQNGILSYRRSKTNQALHIRYEKCMQKIVDKYAISDIPYLLPIIKSTDKDFMKQYNVAIYTINKNLKRTAKLLGLSINLTTYCARHSWASIARSKNIPISVISEGMGHDNEKTTQIYLASLDSQIIDNANKLVISDF